MPIPFILIGAAIAAGLTGVAGVGGHMVAKEDFDKAKKISKDAERKYGREKDLFELKQKYCKERLAKHGNLKAETYTEILHDRFMPLYNRFATSASLSDLSPEETFTGEDAEKFSANLGIASEILSGSVMGLLGGAAGGTAAAAGAWALAGSIGVASTGTAISTLGGAAAFNATAAWLGGGALAAGGLGMAGGAAVLGGLVAGPAILISAFVMTSKAEKAVSAAREYADKVDVACAKIEKHIANFVAIERRCDELAGLIKEFSQRLLMKIGVLQTIVEVSPDNKKDLLMAFLYAKTLMELLNTPIANSEGGLYPGMQVVIASARGIL